MEAPSSRTFEVVLEDDISEVQHASAVFEGFNYDPTSTISDGGTFMHTIIETDGQLSFTDGSSATVDMTAHHVVYQYRVLDSSQTPID